MMSRFSALSSLIFMAWTLNACTMSSMQPPTEIEPAPTKIDINWKRGFIHNDPLNFAPYHANDVDIGWSKGTSEQFGVGMVGKIEKDHSQAFGFTLTKDGATATAHVKCTRNETESGVIVGGLSTGSRKVTLHCELKNEVGFAQIFDGVDEGAGLSGAYQALPLRVDPVFTDQKGTKAINALGYRIYRDGKPVAAIGVEGDQAYYVSPQSESRWDVDIAATAAFLLIFEH